MVPEHAIRAKGRERDDMVTKEQYAKLLQRVFNSRGYVVIASSVVRKPGDVSEENYAGLNGQFLALSAKAVFTVETTFEDFVEQARLMDLPLPGDQTKRFFSQNGFRLYRAVAE